MGAAFFVNIFLLDSNLGGVICMLTMQNSKAKQTTIYFEGKGHVTFKSGAEANRAIILNVLKRGRQIVEWEYEPKFFRFYPPHIPTDMQGKTCGVRKYKIDFEVTELGGGVRYEEVKNGYVTQKDVTKVKCMATYYPSVRVWLVLKSEPRGNYVRTLISKMKPWVERVYCMAGDCRKLGLK